MPNNEGAPAPPRVESAGLPSLHTQVTFAVGALVVAGLYFARDILVPITLAVLLSFVLAPMVRLLRQVWLGKVPAVLTAIVLAALVMLAVGGIIGAQITSLAEDLPRYESVIRQKVETLRDATIGRLNNLFERVEQLRRDPASSGEAAAPAAAPEQPADASSWLPGGDKTHPASPFAVAQSFLTPFLNPIATLGIVFVIATFILLRKEDLRDRFIRLAGSHDLNKTTTALDDAARRLSRFFLTQLAMNVAFGVFIAIGLAVIGVPSPVLWGIVAGLLRFMPYIGGLLAALMPALVAAAVDPGWTMVIATVALFLVTEPLMGQVLEPIVYGHSTGLSPVSVVIATIFWTWLWGPIGLFLATPLTLCLVVIGRHVDRLEFLEVLLGDRPALSPVESFYQRMLAGDPDEVQDQAEILLKSTSLSAYYDTVALKGLKLASEDALRGTLSTQRLFQLRESVEELVEELEEFADAQPTPSGTPSSTASPTPSAEPTLAGGELVPDQRQLDGRTSSVLCVGGASPLDDAAAAMLAQVLEKHGVPTRRLPSDRSARAAIAELDPDGIALICISAIETTGNIGRLRLLARRLRRRLPDASIVLGFWPAGDAELDRTSLSATIGADHWVDSLIGAVTFCLDRMDKLPDVETTNVPAALVTPAAERADAAAPVPLPDAEPLPQAAAGS